MNKEAILKTAALIEQQPDHFNMGKWFRSPISMVAEIIATFWRGRKRVPDCGTQGCIAAFAIVANLPVKKRRERLRHSNPSAVAQAILGLSDKEARHLFYGQWSGERRAAMSRGQTNALDYVSARAAAKRLRKLAEAA